MLQGLRFTLRVKGLGFSDSRSATEGEGGQTKIDRTGL